jgi:hypothetical protein
MHPWAAVLVATVGALRSLSGSAADAAPPVISADLRTAIESHGDAVSKIVGAVVDGPLAGQAWRRLANFTDHIGNRLAGSHALEEGIDRLVGAFAADGLEASTEEAMVPHWTRGNEWAVLRAPHIGGREYHLRIAGLGRSVGTANVSSHPELAASQCVWGGGRGSTVQQLYPPSGGGGATAALGGVAAHPGCGVTAEVSCIRSRRWFRPTATVWGS